MAKKKSDEEVKNDIIQAANVLFVKYGFHKTTMEDIAKLAGKGKSTLYYYYTSKEEVMLGVIRRISQEFLSIIKEKISVYNTAEEKLNAYFLITVQEAERYAQSYFVLRQELSEGFVVNPKVLSDLDILDVLIIKTILTEGHENKEFYFADEEEIFSLSELITIVTKSIIMSAMLEINQHNWEQKILQFGNIIIKSLKN